MKNHFLVELFDPQDDDSGFWDEINRAENRDEALEQIVIDCFYHYGFSYDYDFRVMPITLH